MIVITRDDCTKFQDSSKLLQLSRLVWVWPGRKPGRQVFMRCRSYCLCNCQLVIVVPSLCWGDIGTQLCVYFSICQQSGSFNNTVLIFTFFRLCALFMTLTLAGSLQLYEPEHDKTCKFTLMSNKDSDQPAYPQCNQSLRCEPTQASSPWLPVECQAKTDQTVSLQKLQVLGYLLNTKQRLIRLWTCRSFKSLATHWTPNKDWSDCAGWSESLHSDFVVSGVLQIIFNIQTESC